MFRRYLELGCLAKLSRDLEERGIVTKVSQLASGATGKRIIGMDGRDIYETFERELPLKDVLERRIRRSAETGRIHVPVPELFGLQPLR